MYKDEPVTHQSLKTWDETQLDAVNGADLFNEIFEKNWEYVQNIINDKLDAEKVYTSKELYEILYGLSNSYDEYIYSTFKPGHFICPLTFVEMADDFYDLDRSDKSFAWDIETNQKVFMGID